jgi:DNA-binding LacI/PurR family transcriptional regulator
LSNALQAKGYHILVFTASNARDRIEGVIADLLDYQVDGIITASVGMTGDLAARCEAAGIPVVMFNRGQDGANVGTVTSANIAGGRKVAEFLVSCGHKTIAHISGWGGSSTGRDRHKGFVDGLAAAGMTPSAVIDGMYDRDVAAQATRDLMQSAAPPDAIFVGNDHMAFAVVDVLRHELGLRVPEDVAVVGYDDVPLATWPAYNLTTVRQPLNRMVDASINMLLAQIVEGEIAPSRIEFDGPLIQRGTTLNPKGPAS